MNSLRDLNYESTKAFTFTDPRPIGVTFDRETPDNQVSIDTSEGYKILYPGINFESIVNGFGYFIDVDSYGDRTYDDTNILTSGFNYSVTLVFSGTISSPIDGVVPAEKLRFGGFPNTVDGRLERLKNIGSGGMYVGWAVNNAPSYTTVTYTVYGIKSVADWNAVKTVYTTQSTGTVTSRIHSVYNTLTWTTTFGSGGTTKPWPSQNWPATTGTTKYATVNRQLFVNRTLQTLFDTYTPVIQDTAGGSPTYSVNLTTSAGDVGHNTGDKSTNFTFSGSKTTVNNDFYNIKFWPVTDLTGNQLMTMKVYRDATLIDEQTVPLELLSNSNTPLSSVTIALTNQTIVPPTGFGHYDILLIGGGGAGGKPSTAQGGGGGGGGAGQVLAVVGATVSGNIVANIGNGGAGDNTSTLSTDGHNGRSSNVSVNSSIVYSVIGGFGGEGQSSVNRSGGSTGGVANTTGNLAAGGYWDHVGGNTNVYGGGGGGSLTAGANGTPTTSTNSGGQGISVSDFYLVPYIGTTIGEGGDGGKVGGDATYRGSGGNGGGGTTASGSGSAGAIVIRFY